VHHRSLTALTLGAVTALTAAAGATAAPKRVVTLTPFTANTTVALGVRPVAIGQIPGSNDRFSPKLSGVKVLPLSHPNGPNMEQLAVLNPNLVLSAPTWSKGSTAMRKLGITVRESDPQSVAAVPVQTRYIGRLLGKTKRANEIANQQTSAIAAAKARARGRHRPTVLLILGVGRTPYAFLKNSWGGDVVRRAGGRLLTDGLTGSGGFARISNEVVVKRNPDIIIAVPHSGGNASSRKKLAKYLATNPAWKGTKAVRRKHLYVVQDNSLLQAWPEAASIINKVQTKYLFPGR
jgi:iron complex transport system substrate-binding protein